MDPINNMAQPFTDHSQHTMTKAFGAAFIGALIGAHLNNTHFGRWFNTSKFIGFLFNAIKYAVIGLFVYYLYFVFIVW